MHLIRDVLCAGKTIERAARERGAQGKQKLAWWGGLFRRCLHYLAEIAGFAVKDAYRNRHKQLQRERKRESNSHDPARSEGALPEIKQPVPMAGQQRSTTDGFPIPCWQPRIRTRRLPP